MESPKNSVSGSPSTTTKNGQSTADRVVAGTASCAPIITVVRDPQHTLGKCFDINPDGTVSKKSSVNLSFGIAKMHHVETHEDLAVLLQEVGEDSHAVIINALFPGTQSASSAVKGPRRCKA